MVSNIPAALRELGAILRQLKTLNEWAKLERQEAKPHVPPSFRVSNHVDRDIRVQYAAFVSTGMDIRQELGNPAIVISSQQRNRWERRLRELELELQQLYLPAKLINL